MAEVPSVETTRNATGGFWARQFGERVTRPQRLFDVVFGIIAPAFCLLFDPVVFGSWQGVGEGILQDYRAFGYTITLLSFLTLILWLKLAPRLGFIVAAVAGGLLASAAFAAVVGVRLVPPSLWAIALGDFAVVIGALGFTPFLTAFVFVRNGVRTWRVAKRVCRPLPVVLPAMLGAAIMLGAPALLQGCAVRASAKAIAQIAGGNRQEARYGMTTLTIWRPLIGVHGLVRACKQEADPARRVRLKRAYAQITGRSLAGL